LIKKWLQWLAQLEIRRVTTGQTGILLLGNQKVITAGEGIKKDRTRTTAREHEVENGW
jgi:hypothetical protein